MRPFRAYLWAALLAVLCFAGTPAGALTLTLDDAQIREIVRQEVAAALKGQPTAPPVVAPPTAPAGPNPFIGCKADGLTLYDCILHRLSGRWGGTAAEWDQAVAAGYPRETGIQRIGGGATYDPYSAVLDWDAAANGNGRLYYLRGSGGSKFFTVPPGYVGDIVLEAVANTNSHHNSITATLDGKDPVTVGGWGGPTHKVKLAPGNHEYTVTLDQPGGVTIVLRHYP